MNHWSIRIHSSTFVSNISNISIITIGMIVHILSTSIRESNRVRSSDSSCTIRRFSSIESSIGVVISNSIIVGVRAGLIRVSSRCSMCNQRGMSYQRSMSYYRGMSNNWSNWVSYGMGNGSSMYNRSMDCMNNWTVDSMNNWSMYSMGSRSGNSSMSNRDRFVSSKSRLYLRQTLGVVH